MRQIIFHEETKTFHLYNEKISYILCVLENGHLGQLYFGKRLHDKADFSYLVEKCERPMTSYIYEWDRTFSLEHILVFLDIRIVVWILALQDEQLHLV